MWVHDLDLSGSGHGQVVCICDDGNEHAGCVKCEDFLTNYETISFSRRILLHEFVDNTYSSLEIVGVRTLNLCMVVGKNLCLLQRKNERKKKKRRDFVEHD